MKQGLVAAVVGGPGFLLIAIGEALADEEGPGFLLTAMGDTVTFGGPLAIAVMGLVLTPFRGPFVMLTTGDLALGTGVRATLFLLSPALASCPALCISVSC